ncbi:MAG: radical SAM protein, partial [Lentisphaerae bacterium]|nr:radical SAM protein [Lentisphaerota bacterium]
MSAIAYREPLFRPPAEADSLIFQVAFGCPHNTCAFCLMYKAVRYRLRDQRDLFREIEQAGRAQPRTQRIFLADGDVMRLDYGYLRLLLEHIGRHFPRLARIS